LNYDVIIQGAGLVGSLYALLLKSGNPDIKVLLLDTKPLISTVTFTSEYDLRVSALNLTTIGLFKKAGIWDELKSHRYGVFKNIEIFTNSGNLELDHNDANQIALAYTFENRQIQQVMHRALQGVDFRVDKIESFSQDEKKVYVKSAIGHEYTTHLLVGADGANSFVRRKLKLPVTFTAYEQSAIVGNFKAHGEKNTATQTFSEHGVLAWLPLKDNGYSIVLSTKTQTAKQLLTLNDVDFIKELSIYDKSNVTDIQSISTRAAFPLQGMHAQQYYHGRVVIIGDAAHVIHPLAGQGVNLGFKDAQALAECTAYCTNVKSALHNYQKQRYSNNCAVQKLMESLDYSFVRSTGYLESIKAILLQTANSSVYIKQQMLDIAL